MWRWAGRASHPPRVGSRPLSASSLFVSSSYRPSCFLSAPAWGTASLPLSPACRGPRWSLGDPGRLGCCWGSWAGRPPQGVLRPRDVPGALGCGSALRLIGQESRISSDPPLCGQSLNGFANWCHKQETAPPPVSKSSHLWCRVMGKEKHHRSRLFCCCCCCCYRFLPLSAPIAGWRNPFFCSLPVHLSPPLSRRGDVWCDLLADDGGPWQPASPENRNVLVTRGLLQRVWDATPLSLKERTVPVTVSLVSSQYCCHVTEDERP